MDRKYKCWLFIILMVQAVNANAQVVITSVDSMLAYATARSITLQSAELRLQQARKGKLAAMLGVPDVSGNISFSYTNNTRLPVNLFPAEVFGGQPGTFKEVQTGIKYVTNFNENIDVKLINPKGWENIKLSKLNIAATASDNRLTLKSLLEEIATSYFTIVSLQEQAKSTGQHIAAADSLLSITLNKYEQGIARQQDVNDARINLLSAKETLTQIRYSISGQYLILKVLCDMPGNETISIVENVPDNLPLQRPSFETNLLRAENAALKQSRALSNYRQTKYTLLPTLSFFQSYTNQQYNPRGGLLDKTVNWIPSSYVGFRLVFTIPSANTITQVSQAKYDYLLAKNNAAQQKIEAEKEASQISVDFDKAFSEAVSNQQVYELRRDSYVKNLGIYKEGLIALDQTINSFTSMVTANYNLIASKVNVMLAKTKVEINNRIK